MGSITVSLGIRLPQRHSSVKVVLQLSLVVLQFRLVVQQFRLLVQQFRLQSYLCLQILGTRAFVQ